MAAVAALLMTAACGDHTAPAPTDDAVAMASTERKAVADTDGARRDAAMAGHPAEQN